MQFSVFQFQGEKGRGSMVGLDLKLKTDRKSE